MSNPQTVKIQLVRSPIGTKESHRATVRGLGLRKLNSVSELQDTPAVRGMMPNANTVKRDKAPPENMLNKLKMPPC